MPNRQTASQFGMGVAVFECWRMRMMKAEFASCIWLALSLAGVDSAVAQPATQPAGPNCEIWVEDSLVLVPEDRSMPQGAPQEIELDVARGEYEAAQIVVRPQATAIAWMRVECGELEKEGGAAKLPAPRVRFVDSVPLRVNIGGTPEGRPVVKAPAWIPDPLYDVPNVDVWQNKARPIWLTFKIPSDAEPGIYTGQVRVFANEAVLSVPMNVRVYKAAVPAKGTLKVTSWLRIDNIASWGGCELFDGRFWGLVRAYAENMAAHRHNVIFTPVSEFYTPAKLVTISAQDGRLRFDFSNFDRWVEIFKEAGAIGYVEGGHIGAKGNVHCWVLRNGQIVHEMHPIDSPQAEEYLAQFFRSLQAHLDQKGWTDIYYQHLMDEPREGWTGKYNAALRLARRYVPRIKIIEATLTTGIEQPDIVVPVYRQFEANRDLYRKLQESGREVWFYTTVMGRELGDHLLKARYVHWLNFKYNTAGYLHWGYNWWETLTPFTQTQVVHSPRGPFPPGSHAAVYPAPNGLIDSIRWETARDGIEDYELLKALEAKDPKKARAMCDSLVRAFADWDLDVGHFRAARRELLAAIQGGVTDLKPIPGGP